MKTCYTYQFFQDNNNKNSQKKPVHRELIMLESIEGC